MKKIFSAIALIISLNTWAQQKPTQYIGAPNNKVDIRGDLKVDSAFYLPSVGDTTPYRPGALRYNPTDSSIEYWTVSGWKKPGGSSVQLMIDRTYSQLTTAMSAGTLTPGAFYKITDFKTVYKVYGTSADSSGSTEPIIVQAITTSKIGPFALSTVNPQDVLEYQVTDASPLAPTSGSKGLISYRRDTKSNLSAYYDWRVVKWRRWGLAVGGIYFAFQPFTPAVNTSTNYVDVLTFSSDNKNIDIGESTLNVNIGSSSQDISIGKECGSVSSGIIIGDACSAIRIADHCATITTSGGSAGSGYVGGIVILNDSRYINIGHRNYNIAIGSNCYALEIGNQNSDVYIPGNSWRRRIEKGFSNFDATVALTSNKIDLYSAKVYASFPFLYNSANYCGNIYVTSANPVDTVDYINAQTSSLSFHDYRFIPLGTKLIFRDTAQNSNVNRNLVLNDSFHVAAAKGQYIQLHKNYVDSVSSNSSQRPWFYLSYTNVFKGGGSVDLSNYMQKGDTVHHTVAPLAVYPGATGQFDSLVLQYDESLALDSLGRLKVVGGGGGGGSDGNNYPTSLSYSSDVLTLARSGLSALTATIPLSGKVSASDTASMLSNYRHWLQSYVKASDTSAMLTNYRHWVQGYIKASDTASMLANYRHWLAGYIKIADTASMLSTYRHWTAGYTKNSDTATMLSGYVRKIDTASMLLPYQHWGQGYLKDITGLVNTGFGLNKTGSGTGGSPYVIELKKEIPLATTDSFKLKFDANNYDKIIYDNGLAREIKSTSVDGKSTNTHSISSNGSLFESKYKSGSDSSIAGFHNETDTAFYQSDWVGVNKGKYQSGYRFQRSGTSNYGTAFFNLYEDSAYKSSQWLLDSVGLHAGARLSGHQFAANPSITGIHINNAGKVLVDNVSSGSLTDSVLVIANREIKKIDGSLLRNFANTNLTFTGDREHNVGEYSLDIYSNSSEVILNDNGFEAWRYSTGSTESGLRVLAANAQLSHRENGRFTSAVLDSSYTELSVTNSNNGRLAWVRLSEDSLLFERQQSGVTTLLDWRLRNLPSTTVGATKWMMTYDTVTRKVEYAAIPSGGSGGSGTVTSVGSGFGTNFSTITSTGNVVVDSTVMASKAFVIGIPAYSMTSTAVSNAATAYSWGNHASAGYFKSGSNTVSSATTFDATTTNKLDFTGDVNGTPVSPYSFKSIGGSAVGGGLTLDATSAGGSRATLLSTGNGAGIGAGYTALFDVGNTYVWWGNGNSFVVNSAAFKVNALAGSGTRMVTTDASGNISTQSIPSASSAFFGKSGGDVTAGENRAFNANNFNFNIDSTQGFQITKKQDATTGYSRFLMDNASSSLIHYNVNATQYGYWNVGPNFANLYANNGSQSGSLQMTATSIATNRSFSMSGLTKAGSPVELLARGADSILRPVQLGTNLSFSGLTLNGPSLSGYATQTGTETLTNKTLTSPKINVGSDAQGDIYYRDASGNLARLAPGTSGQVLKTNGAGADPSWTTVSGTGTVTSVSVTTANGVSGSVATSTTTPAITLTLGAITPSSVAATGAITSSSSSAGIGYTTGSGSTVTQATSKSTGVTINTPTGAITMNNAALASNTTVAFTVTNSSVAATDVVVVSLKSGHAANGYVITIGAVAAGSFQINVLNGTGSSRSDALVINYAIIKGSAN